MTFIDYDDIDFGTYETEPPVDVYDLPQYASAATVLDSSNGCELCGDLIKAHEVAWWDDDSSGFAHPICWLDELAAEHATYRMERP